MTFSTASAELQSKQKDESLLSIQNQKQIGNSNLQYNSIHSSSTCSAGFLNIQEIIAQNGTIDTE